MTKYDLGFMFICYDLNNGCFYDTFEYFYLFKSMGYNCCFIMAVRPETEQQMMESLKDRYDVNFDEIRDNIYYFDFDDVYYRFRSKVFPIMCRTLFVPGSSAFDTIVTSKILLPHKSMYVMYDRPYSGLSSEFHDRKSYYKNVKILYDDRIMKKLSGFTNIPYKKKVNFSIFKEIEKSDDRICLSLYCDHKCYDIDFLSTIIDEFPKDKFFLYTKTEGKYAIEYYSKLRSDRVIVEKAPVKDFMTKFNRFLYLSSIREFDPSPRIVAECRHYNKEVIVYDQEKLNKIKDGGYYRLLDCNDIDSITLNKKDEIVKIYEENR